MSITVQEYKEKIQQNVLNNPASYIQPDSLYRIGIKAFSENTNTSPEFTFASDEKIQDYLNGNMESIGGLCCLACVKIFGSENCVSPHLGPCNMC